MNYQELAELAERINHLKAVLSDKDRVLKMARPIRYKLYSELLFNEELFNVLTMRRG